MPLTGPRRSRADARSPAGGGPARLSRRDLCGRLIGASSVAALGGCAQFRSGAGGRDAALLLPLSGPAAALGQNMAQAASLVVTPGPRAGQPPVFDTADTPEGARVAAERALAGGARMLLGPLTSEQTPEVLAVAGSVPVVTFSNDERLAALGGFVMGVTPAQSVATAFSFARAEGVGRIAVVARPSPLAEAAATAARRLAPLGGLTLTAVLLRESATRLVADLRAASGGSLPQAVYLPDGGAELTAFAGALSGSGVQLLGSVQWGVADFSDAPTLEGALFAAPPPNLFVPFLDTFAARFGEGAGVVTALGHDAALMAAELGNSGALDRRGLTRPGGFTGVLGPFRFLETGRCQRDLAVLTLEAGRIVAVGEVAGT